MTEAQIYCPNLADICNYMLSEVHRLTPDPTTDQLLSYLDQYEALWQDIYCSRYCKDYLTCEDYTVDR